MRGKLFSNLLVAFLSQGISLVLSVLMSFILPKMFGVNQYSYSQLFIFYIGYVGFFHFGINDGLYLRLGGQKYERLNHRSIGAEFRFFLLFEIIIAFIICGLGLVLFKDHNRQIVILLAAIYLVINNLALCLGYIFQAVNETKWFSYSVMIDRIIVIVSIVVLLMTKQTTYVPFIVLYTCSRLISLMFCIWKGRKIVFSKWLPLSKTLRELWNDASIGIKLTISNIVALLILGVGRMIVDNIWGVESFGKISLAFSLTNFFLVFIQQVSMVMFPALRQIEKHKQIDIFIFLRSGVNTLAPAILVFYIPLQFVLGLWLPEYSESLVYLAYLLPICIFDGKMQMIFTTYFKVLRQEKRLMFINIISLIFSSISCFICGYILGSMTAVVASMVIAIIFRSILSDHLLSKSFGQKIGREILYEIVLILSYIVIVSNLSGIMAFLATLGLYVIYLLLNHKEVKMLIESIKSRKVFKET